MLLEYNFSMFLNTVIDHVELGFDDCLEPLLAIDKV